MSKKCVARIGGRGELSIPGELIETPLCQRYYNQESWSKGLHDGTVARGGALQLLGERDRYLWFNGEDNYVSVFIDEFGIINGVTLDFWWFVEKLNKHQQMGIYTSGEPRLYLGAHEDNRVFGSVGDSYDGFGELTLGWHHLAIKASSNIMDGIAMIYLDGNPLGQFMFMGSSVGGIFTIGARGSNFSRPMRGVIREVKLWKRELSSSEIKDSMNGLIIPEYEEGVYPDLGYWPLNEGTGNTVQNRVNGSYDPITGATWIDGPVKYREPGSWISVPFDLKQITNASGSLIKFESSHPSTKVYTTVGEGKDLIADGLPVEENWAEQTSGEPISNIIPGVDYSGKHLWAKVKITPDDNDPSSS